MTFPLLSLCQLFRESGLFNDVNDDLQDDDDVEVTDKDVCEMVDSYSSPSSNVLLSPSE